MITANRDWFDMSKRLRRKMFEMQAKGTLYGYKWVPIGGQWVILLVRNKDVYKEDRRSK